MALQVAKRKTFRGMLTPALNEPVVRFDYQTSLDSVRIVAYPWQQPATDISNVIISLTWTESAELASREMTLVVDNSSKFARRDLAPGTWMNILIREPATGRFTHKMQFYVWERELSDSATARATITGLDLVSFLQRQGPRDWSFRHDKAHPYGWTATQIARRVLSEFDIKFTLPRTSFRIEQLLLRQHTPFEVLVKAFTRDRIGSGSRYRIKAVNDRIVVSQFLWQNTLWDFREGRNLISATWSESLEGVKTEIVGHTTDRKGGNRVLRVLSPDVRRYGRLREDLYYRQSVATPKELERLATVKLKRQKTLQREARITALGVPGVRASDAVTIVDSGTGLRGRFFVDTVTHKMDSSGYTMDMQIKYVATLPEQMPSRDEIGRDDAFGTVVRTSSTGAPIASPLGPEKFIRVVGRPNTAAHRSSNWTTRCAIDLRAAAGADIFSSISGTVVRVDRSRQHLRSGHICGVSIIVRHEKTNLNCFFSRLTNIPEDIVVGKKVLIGQTKLGEVIHGIESTPDFVHFATHVGDWKKFEVKECTSDPAAELQLDGEDNTSLGAATDDNPAVPSTGTTSNWPGNEASESERALWLAYRAQEAGLPHELPVMAALVESGMRNLPYGDRDSVGIFQMRLSIWNRGEYTGYPGDPDLQMRWFIAQALATQQRYRFVGGDSSRYGEWCQAIERSAFPDKYQKQYAKARQLLGRG